VTRGTLLGLALLSVLACNRTFDPASKVVGLRVLAIRAEPPEVPPGQATTLDALAFDTSGAPLATSWMACTEPALLGTGTINPDCVKQQTAPFLIPLGQGIPLTATLPMINPSIFGPPDPSGGLYLPVRLQVETADDLVSAIYRMRLAQGDAPPNHNPSLAAVLVVPPAGEPTPLDPATPLDVSAGGKVTLRATFVDGSAESYSLSSGGTQTTVTELLRVSWFATAGSFDNPVTGESKPDTVFTADGVLPPAGSPIDLYVVGRDERGGTDYTHRQLVLR